MGEAQWPEIAVPVGEQEVGVAVEALRAGQSWAVQFTGAALVEHLEALYGRGWCNQAVARAVVFRPDGTRYGQPPVSAQDTVRRWSAWASPPVIGHELGIALAAQFRRDSEHTVRDDWGNKTIPTDPVQVFRAARWMRFTYGWSTFGALKALVVVLAPFFAAGWCPAAIVWAVENRPKGAKYPAPAQNIEQIRTRLAAWESRRDAPPIAGATWERTVGLRRERARRESSASGDTVQRWRGTRQLHDERWKYRRTIHAKREEDQRTQQVMEALHPDPRRLVGTPPPARDFGGSLCRCMRYERLPGLPTCVACVNEKRR
ncbi:hypothetical protein [Actinokineospora globicatena]|uniref:hypothetical protein n=1 Tax=Actinokineospora globicatena TaxID=103729 RepID=UPI0020A3EB81|nr:hypothetical protein [Actinokineospora globicatena]MCP2306463.1 hypothetical protein [Actinokineospora globicatena]GLW81892.1 hypothetical protein Aglo01_63730 [Actinokineospora globicatena]GLW88686.1 hypothetical protein Aglo02_63250 [Actinokineospora globicatena]